MRKRKNKRFLLILAVAACCAAGCSEQQNRQAEADFSGIRSVCELATLKCYYHNVARAETEASGLFKWLGTGYKKIWTEYSGIIELGIDINQVEISEPDASGHIKIAIPDAEILNVDLEEESMGEPLTDTGFLTKITKEEETLALAAAQEDMEETARANAALFVQAKERAKRMIEGYVKNMGEQIGVNYTIEWVEVE